MIRLNKTTIPAILQENAADWTTVILRKIENNEDITKTEKNRYSHQTIKEALVLETNSKCAYCESKIRHIAYGDIEHITPKNPNPHLWFDWSNLTLACDICNTKKAENENLVDPYQDQPETRIIFFGSIAISAPGDDTALSTLRILELNRPDLKERRQERVDYLNRFLGLIEKSTEPAKTLLLEDFRRELLDSAEYASLSRSYAKIILDATGIQTI